MMDMYTGQVKMTENGRQIGYSTMDGDILSVCAIQKYAGKFYVYLFEGDLADDPFGENGTHKKEYRIFEVLSEAVGYISSKGSHFEKFMPCKGSKQFDPNDRHFYAV